MRVFVTQDDIDRGVSITNNCPVARAIKRAVGPGVYPTVSTREVMFHNDLTQPALVVLPLPDHVKAFIYQFDAFGRSGFGNGACQCSVHAAARARGAEDVHPFSFDLDVPINLPGVDYFYAEVLAVKLAAHARELTPV